MPDISMCANNECPSRRGCYRYRAVPDPYWQAYSVFEYDERGRCNCYWHLMKGDKILAWVEDDDESL